MRKHKKTRANSGETLVEVTASIFIFLIMLGIIQGAISYSQASLAKNKEIRSENAKIIEGLQSAATQEEMVKNMQFVATNSDLTVKEIWSLTSIPHWSARPLSIRTAKARRKVHPSICTKQWTTAAAITPTPIPPHRTEVTDREKNNRDPA